MNEQVLVFPAEALENIDFGGRPILSDAEAAKWYLEDLLAQDILYYADRSEAEEDESVKQLIPYVLIQRGREIFRYERTPKSGEVRLHNKWSVGVGGHINLDDKKFDSHYNTSYQEGFRRELLEETGLDGALDAALIHRPFADEDITGSVVGLIYDDSDAVGRVHFGVVHRLKIGFNTPLKFRDASLANGHFQHVVELKQSPDKFENWSRLVIDHIL